MRIIRGDEGAYKTIRLHAVEKDRKLSWKAVGLLTYLVSRPPGWDVTMSDLIRRHSDGKSSVHAAKKELMEGGYVRVLGPRTDEGRFSSGDWVVLEKPLTSEREWRKLLKKLELDAPELKAI